jgi:DNA-binding NtrC family response regulator
VDENVSEVADLNQRTVLAITKRSAQLCGMQALLHASGIELVAAASMKSARRVIKDDAVKGVIVCLHSWSERERNDMAAELEANHPEVAVIVRCPGCSGCDEARQIPGTLCETQPIASLKYATFSAAKP